MINWAQDNGHTGIYTIVSRAMLTILKRSGWQIQTLKEAFLSERERIYLIYLPAGEDDQRIMARGLNGQTASVFTWPLTLPV